MRDLLPPDAGRHATLSGKLTRCFELSGYERVATPLFEFAEVMERGLGSREAPDMLRFVEPETGGVVSLRPDMTLQVARLVATRLGDAPSPVRLCYHGSVLRQRGARARRQRQIPQVGIELIGSQAPAGDLEVLSLAAAAARAAGLAQFVIDLGHARIAGALVEDLPAPAAEELLEALEAKDDTELLRRAERLRLPLKTRDALVALPGLSGAEDVFPRAQRVLAGTPAAPALLELKELYGSARGLANGVLVDLGETRDLTYYTGALFQIHAEGPGRALGAGGRYDGLLGRFGHTRPAAGFAFDLDDVAWALNHAGGQPETAPRILVLRSDGNDDGALLSALREQGLACAGQAPSPLETALAYARYFRYTGILDLSSGEPAWIGVESGKRTALPVPPGPLVSEVVRIVRER